VVFLVLIALVLVNSVCWLPGVGTCLTLPERPKGTEVELYYGWPATYRAELWRSNDPTLARRILASAPFYRPGGEMERHVRYTGGLAIALDVLFGLTLAGLAAIAVESYSLGASQAWFRWATPILLIGLVILYLGSGQVGVHL
jgi:hypothetical protein